MSFNHLSAEAAKLKYPKTSALILTLFITLTILAFPNTTAATATNLANEPNLDNNYKSWVDGSTFQYQVHPIASTTSYAEGIMANTVFELRNAYDLNPLYFSGFPGKGQTVVIVDAYSSPTIYEDFLMFILWQNANGANLPWTTIQQVKNHLHIYYPMGKPNFNANDPEQLSWSTETTLDVDMVHAIAPQADIALVIAPNSNNRPLDYTPSYTQLHIT